MKKIDKECISLDNNVEIINEERLSLDVVFRVTSYIEGDAATEDVIENEDSNFVWLDESIETIDDEFAVVGKTDVKVYDDKWVDFFYAADSDGAHTDIFGVVVEPVVKNSVTKTIFKKNDGMVKGKHMVWGRVAVMDTNFHSFDLDKKCWNKEIAKEVFSEMEDYLVDILNIDFLVLDLNFRNIDTIKTNPGLLLLGDTEKLLTLQNENDLQELKMEVYGGLSDLGFIPAASSNNVNYMIKKYDSNFSYQTDSKNNDRKIRGVLKSF